MGLDMYAYTALRELTEHRISFGDPAAFDGVRYTLIHDWRKHYDLDAWMDWLFWTKRLWLRKRDGRRLELTRKDLDRLERDLTAPRRRFSFHSGFADSSRTRVEDDLAFIAKARTAIAEGHAVYYSSTF